MNNINIVIFDCDGVMFDTTIANMEYYNNILKHFGKPELTAEQFEYVHMHTADESINFLFDDQKIHSQVIAYRKTLSYLPFLKFMEIEPYLKQLIKHLRPKYKTAIATNRSDTMDSVLSEFGIEKYFDMVVTSLNVKNPKPYPDQLNKILDNFMAAPADAMFIGDSITDQKAANAAGVCFIACKNKNLEADFYINSLKEVEQILNVRH